MLTVTVLTKNSEQVLATCLESACWANEIVVLDTGSTDRTIEIASAYPNVTLHTTPFTDFGSLRNQVAALASYDWIFTLDSDEAITPELRQELQQLNWEADTVYSVPIHTRFRGKRIRGCGWGTKRGLRLYHRTHTSFSMDKVHEQILTEGMRVEPLIHPLTHVSYSHIEDFLKKMQLYTDLFAQQHVGKRRGSLLHALSAKWIAFFKSYVCKWGFLDGIEGYLISCYNAQTAYYKYLKLWEANRNAAVPRRKR